LGKHGVSGRRQRLVHAADHGAALQPYRRDIGPEYHEPHESRDDYRQHHLSAVRTSDSDRGTPNGEGFLENANNRRLELQIRFTY
jgi:hypothetical protein